jgi:hypothetical protein
VSVIDVHTSIYCPEEQEAIAQCQLRERVPMVPSNPESLGMIDYESLREQAEEMGREVTRRTLEQLDKHERYHRTRRGDSLDGSAAERELSQH